MVNGSKHSRVLTVGGIVVIAGALALSMLSIAQPVPKGVLKCWMEPSSTEVLPLEPLWVVVNLKNETSKRQKVTESWQLFRFVRIEKGEWRIYYPENLPTRLPPRPRSVEFQPSEVQSWPTYYDFDAHAGGAHVFAKPGNVELKVSIGRTESAPVTITVVEPKGVDARAFESLRESKLARYFSNETLRRYPYTRRTVTALERFVRTFPGSKYMEHAQLGMALMWWRGVQGTIDIAKAKELLTDLSKRGGAVMAVRASYYLGHIAQEQGELNTARRYYEGIIGSEVDPYFRHLAGVALKEIQALQSKSEK